MTRKELGAFFFSNKTHPKLSSRVFRIELDFSKYYSIVEFFGRKVVFTLVMAEMYTHDTEKKSLEKKNFVL